MEDELPKSEDYAQMTGGERVLQITISNHLKPLIRAVHWLVGLNVFMAFILGAIAKHMGAWKAIWDWGW